MSLPRITVALTSLLVACGSGSENGTSDGTFPVNTTRVVVNAQIGPGTSSENDASKCQLPNTPWLTIGKFGPPVDVAIDGEHRGENRIAAVCTVRPEGDGFRVDAFASVDKEGSLTLTGHVRATGDQLLAASFQRPDTGTFEQSGCTLTYEYPPMGAATGRIWGMLHCPAAASSTGQTCMAVAEFRFENCSQ
jgi:hypothetical protein